MAVYTDVAAEDLSRFLAGYDIGGLLSYKGIAEGVENSNFLVHTESGHFILTLYERRVAERDLPFFLSLMEHLASRGINCPQPVRNRAGKVLGKLAGRPAAIVTYLDGMWIRRPSAAHCGALGDHPTLTAALDAIEKARKRGEIGFDRAEFLPHADNHRRLGDGAVFIQPDHRGKQMMARPAAACGKAGPATLDKLFERTAKPRHRNMSVGGESAAQLFPFALVAIGAPGLDEFGDCGFIGKFHWLRLAHSHHKIAQRRHAIALRRYS